MNREQKARDLMSAIRSKSITCRNGHVLDETNLYVCPQGKRGCKECRRQRNREHYGRNGRTPRAKTSGSDLTQEKLKSLISYDPETGILQRITGPRSGHAFGSPHGDYLRGVLGGRLYLAHRLAWLYVHGEWPEIIDHVNGDGTDNRISNLRNATRQTNPQNRHRIHSTSGILGVSWRPEGKKWSAAITAKGRSYRLGSFSTKAEAESAYLEAKQRLHSYWAEEVNQ